VLVLHSWWGLTPYFRRVADRLADAGFVALAPDLHLGHRAATESEARALLASMDPNVVADLVVSSAATLQGMPATAGAPIGVVGFSMGASWALWLAARRADTVGAVVAFYGTQDIDFRAMRARVQLHAAEHDDFVSDDELTLLEAGLRLDGVSVDVLRHPGTGHWFMEADRPDAFVEDAAERAWEHTIRFLRRELVVP
jgi:carboxymethylenebutenolidase